MHSYIKGFIDTLDFPGIQAEPIIFDNPDGSHQYIGWNILLETPAEQIQGDLNIGTPVDTYTFHNVTTVDTLIKGELLLLHATQISVNKQVK